MRPDDVTQLLEKLEAAEEGDEALDQDVDRAIGKPVRWPAPRYTRSLDAALQLLPDDNAPMLRPIFHRGSAGYYAEAYRVARYAISPTDHCGRAPTPALALVIAALKGRFPDAQHS